MDQLSDEEILEQIRQGDMEAFRYLFDKYYEPLCFRATLLTGDGAMAKDVVQQVFISFWEQKRYEAVQTSLIAYLRSMVRYVSADLIRKEKMGNEKLQAYAFLMEGPEGKDLIELSELSKEMNSAIEELPPQCKALFKAVYLEGKKYNEAAEEAGISINTVKEQLRRAFRKMREKLKNLRYFF